MLRCIVVIIFFLISSCNNYSSDDLAIYKSLNEGMEKSVKNTFNNNAVIYMSLANKLTDPSTAQRATLWKPRFDSIKILSDSLAKYIRYLKIDLQNISSKDNETGGVKQIFIDQDKSKELMERMQVYKRNMLGIDKRMEEVFANRSSNILVSIDTSLPDFTKKYFKGKPAIAVVSFLTMLENNVRLMESDFVNYCNNHIVAMDEGFRVFSVLVGKSTSHIKGGDQMLIQAGVGAFSLSSKPLITINGKTLEPGTEGGVATYKFKTSLKAGKYVLPVKVEYTDEMGIRKIHTSKVEYTVIE
ncbi:MAG: hypothetical protein ABUT20_51155 [Bacteroidota bacterium]